MGGEETKPIGQDFDRFLEKEISEQEGAKDDPSWQATFVFPSETATVSGAEFRALVDGLNQQGGEGTAELLERMPLSGEIALSSNEAQLVRAAWPHVKDESEGLAGLKAALDRNCQ